jgi:nicotinate-nucleotide adenylyltransferase
MSARRIGLLGGTFDPVHAGHLDIARWCAAELGLHEVRFLCSHVPPHKAQPVAAAHHRHAMVALATEPHADFVADPRELLRGGTTFTVETLEELSAERPGTELLFLVGADSLRDLRTWRRPDDILRLAVVVAVARDGVSLKAAGEGFRDEIAAGRVVVRSHRPPPWSSTALRRALLEGTAPAGALPGGVADYIRKNDLYQGGGESPAGPRRTP